MNKIYKHTIAIIAILPIIYITLYALGCVFDYDYLSSIEVIILNR